MGNTIQKAVQKFGAGILIAAAGIGAGDLMVSLQAGMHFQWLLVFTALVACVLKYHITLEIALFGQEKGISLISYWSNTAPYFLKVLFLLFFILWSYFVGAALISTTALATSALFQIDNTFWIGVGMSIFSATLVYFGKMVWVERITSFLIALLIVILVPALLYFLLNPNPISTRVFPEGNLTLMMALLGGVGGSVTMLSYGYWVGEKDMLSKDLKSDLRVSYGITALFILGFLGISYFSGFQSDAKGTGLIFDFSSVFNSVYGEWGALLIRICFFAVAFSSLLAVWSGVPYLFSDFMAGIIKPSTKYYSIWLIFLTLVPLISTYLVDTLKNVINYALISSLFVVGITVLLLLLSKRKIWLGLGLLVFGGLFFWQLFF